MAEQAEQEVAAAQAPVDDDDETGNTGYKAPAFKTKEDIKKLDQEDESLRKYKEALLGNDDDTLEDPSNPKQVIVKEVLIVIEGRESLKLDLPESEQDKKKVSKVVIKEGTDYRVQIKFRVQKEIVTGLKYYQTTHRKGIRLEKISTMMGSYAPRKDPHVFMTEVDTAPSGMLARGEYKMRTKFIDDDKNVHFEWDWILEIKKDFD